MTRKKMKSVFEASPQRDVVWRPKCRRHAPNVVVMRDAILRTHFPAGSLPVRGFRCDMCGDEVIAASDAQEAQDLARTLGLFGLQQAQTRKLRMTGNSLAVSLDPA